MDKAPSSRQAWPMACAHGLVENENVFAIDTSSITFGPGAAAESGSLFAQFGCRRVAVFTDACVARLGPVSVVKASLAAAGIDFAVYDACRIEPKDKTLYEAIAFARDGHFDGYVSVGGGSTIDTCKLASLFATYPADLLAYVNAPLGEGRPVPGRLPIHVACPTTCGTGSECTGIAVFDFADRNVKTAVASRRLRPTAALVDPTFSHSLPAQVVAASGFDVLCHALESYTARPFTARARPSSPSDRPMSQGRNPWSDLGSLEALRLGGRFFARAVRDANDHEAREGLSWAATLAGVAFGNAGVHLPHAMSYAVAGLSRTYRSEGYPNDGPLVPHGISVVVNAPSVFRATAASSPERHLAAAEALGVKVAGAAAADSGELLGARLVELMKLAEVPLGLRALGFGLSDTGSLATGALLQKRLVDNAPCSVSEDLMRALFVSALDYARPS